MSDHETARMQEQIKTLFSDVTELKQDLKEIKQNLSNLLPPWATLALATLTAAVGWLAGH